MSNCGCPGREGRASVPQALIDCSSEPLGLFFLWVSGVEELCLKCMVHLLLGEAQRAWGLALLLLWAPGGDAFRALAGQSEDREAFLPCVGDSPDLPRQ